MHYSLTTPVIVIIIEALAEELLALLIVVITSLLGLPVSATEMAVSLKPNRNNPVSRIAAMTRTVSLFTFTTS
jgi:hypothetical protein